MDRPILFQGAMVRALLAGTKTQTRRAVKLPPEVSIREVVASLLPNRGDLWDFRRHMDNPIAVRCPYGQPGDRLWVREAFGEVYDFCDHPEMPGCPDERWNLGWKYRADGEVDRDDLEGFFTGWKPSIHMPRAVSRITLEITDVRVQRLWDISEADAQAEGWDGTVLGYAKLWESINGKGSWDANPWVWAVSFRPLAP
jgi:hypothetical protein